MFRLLAFEQTETRTRVSYRWLEDPFASPRLLIDSPPVPLTGIRSVLENEILGEALRPDEYLIATAQVESVPTLSDVFSGFLVQLVADCPFERLSFAAAPLAYPAAIAAAERYLAPYAPDPFQALAALVRLRNAQVRILGFAGRARLRTRHLLPELHIPIQFSDPDQDTAAEDGQGLTVTLVSVCTDPGLSARESRYLEQPNTNLLIHDCTEVAVGSVALDTTALGELKRQWPTLIILTAPSSNNLKMLLKHQLGAALIDWCEQHFGWDRINSKLEQRLDAAYQCFSELIP